MSPPVTPKVVHVTGPPVTPKVIHVTGLSRLRLSRLGSDSRTYDTTATVCPSQDNQKSSAVAQNQITTAQVQAASSSTNMWDMLLITRQPSNYQFPR